MKFEWIDLLVLLPIGLDIWSSDALAPLFGFQILGCLYLMKWVRNSDAYRAEALTKYGLSVSMGTLLIAGSWQIFQSEGLVMLWPFSVWLTISGTQVIGMATFAVGALLILGLAPLQQGLVDLSETSSKADQVRISLFLTLGLAAAFLHLLPFIQKYFPSPMLNLLAVLGVLSLCCMRLVGGVQMNVSRSAAYLICSAFLPFFLVILIPVHEPASVKFGVKVVLAVLSVCSFLILLVLYRTLLSSVKGPDSKWDDPLPLKSVEKWVRNLLIWDFLQALVGVGLLIWLMLPLLAILVAFYALCNVSVLLDRNAYRLKPV